MNSKFAASLSLLEEWFSLNGWDGWDPLDLPDYFVAKRVQQEALAIEEKEALLYRERHDPLSLRTVLGIKPRRNPAALGHLLYGYSTLFRASKNADLLLEASRIASWLLENPSGGYDHLCWGHPFNRESVMFIPINTPTVVVSTTIGAGLFALYEASERQQYLDACVSICEFILKDLRRDDMGKFGLCFSYTPFDDYHIHMANLAAAEFLARVGEAVDNSHYIDLAQRAALYTIREQSKDGSISYWGQVQGHYSTFHSMHLHSALCTRKLYSLSMRPSLSNLSHNLKLLLEHYLSQYFDSSDLPRDGLESPGTVDIRNLAESISLFAKMSSSHGDLLARAQRGLSWAIDNMQMKDGSFAWLWRNDQRSEIPLMRWGLAPMLRAIADYKIQVQRQSTER